MTHPIVGIWAVDIDLGGQHTFVTHTFHADGIMHIKAGYGESDILWRATGERTFRLHGQIPIEPEAFQFVGWQYLDGEWRPSVVRPNRVARRLITLPTPMGPSDVASSSRLESHRGWFSTWWTA